MKKLFILFNCFFAYSIFNLCDPVQAQTVSGFENLALPVDTFWNGSDFSGGFTSGHAFFPNTYMYDSVYGGYWSTGFAYSSMRDTLTGDFTNMYSVRAGVGYNSSEVYAVGQNYSRLRLTGAAAGKVVNGFYICNSMYAASSMQNGDAFAKKFGGTTGDDPDWFKISITGYYSGIHIADTVDFYLADYRFSDNSQDYILKQWAWLDLTPLGNVDSLEFLLNSTDTGQFGMNTPPFFCMDDFTTADSPQNIDEPGELRFSFYPNPAIEGIYFDMGRNDFISNVTISDMTGKVIFDALHVRNGDYISLKGFAKGMYIVTFDGIPHKLIIR